MNQGEVLEYYSRKDVQEAMLACAQGREIAGVFPNGSFGSRPNVLAYRNDIVSLVKSGVVEFHSSLERWSNPMAIRPDNHGELRTGWDIILDLDCDLTEHGKIAAQSFAWGLKEHGIKNFSVKFTGGTGFHIGIPWESMPKSVNFKPASAQFPDIARQVSLYLKEYVREHFERALLKKYSPHDLAKQLGTELEKIVTDTGIDPYKAVDVDPVLIAPRHLFRMPYSIHRNSFLTSLPIDPKNIGEFEKEHAKPDRIKAIAGFLGAGSENEAAGLVTEAMDWYAKRKSREKHMGRGRIEYSRKVGPELFPPCMQLISQGLSDGRKRSVFILINFLRTMRWKWDEAEKYIEEWNQRNIPPLPESYIRGQIRWHRAQKGARPPPNCLKEAYFPAIGVCRPDHTCTGSSGQITIKNPANYPFVRMRSMRKIKSRKKK